MVWFLIYTNLCVTRVIMNYFSCFRLLEFMGEIEEFDRLLHPTDFIQ